jgi:TRAP-type C4-dicarboxylate transport system substrate-binding protein
MCTQLASAQAWLAATGYSDQTFQTRNLRQFVQELAAIDGLRPVEVSSTFKAGEVFGAVRSGRVQMGEFILSALSSEHPSFALDSIPFLVASYADARLLWASSRPRIEAALKARGVVLLYAVPWPAQHLYTTLPLSRIEDLRGQRIRTYNATTRRIAELSGARGVQVELADLGKALDAGEIDAMLTSSISGIDSRAWRRMRYFYTVSAGMPKNVVVMHASAFEALSATQQSALRRVAVEAESRGWAWSEEEDRLHQRELARNGIRVLAPPLLLSTQVRHFGDVLVNEWLKAAGLDGLKQILEYEERRSK